MSLRRSHYGPSAPLKRSESGGVTGKNPLSDTDTTRALGGHITLIALTGWGQEEDRLHTSAAGFDHHLVKPVDPVALGKLLAELPPPSRGAQVRPSH